MSVVISRTDNWLQHLVFTGPRPTIYGNVDGIFYGVVSGDGDASGGILNLSGLLSVDRKEDWVYVLQSCNAQKNSSVAQDVGVRINSGPLIPTDSAVQNPSFGKVGASDGVVNHAVSMQHGVAGGRDDWQGLVVFGDKKIPGAFTFMATEWTTNEDGIAFTTSLWGWLIRYNNFFRGG